MAKNYQNDKRETCAPAVPEQVGVALGGLVGEVREGLLALAVGTGLQVLTAMMEADVTAAASDRGSGANSRPLPTRFSSQPAHSTPDRLLTVII